MTFQVAAIASDGIVIGSDRRQLNAYFSEIEEISSVQKSETTKFEHSPSGEVICAFAGGPGARSWAIAIANTLDPRSNSLEQQRAISKASHEFPEDARIKNDVLIATSADLSMVQLASRKGRTDPNISAVRPFITSGDLSIPARFLLDHFWADAGVEQIKRLVLLTIYCASLENPTGIGDGIDLIILDRGGPRWEKYRADEPFIVEMWMKLVRCGTATWMPD